MNFLIVSSNDALYIMLSQPLSYQSCGISARTGTLGVNKYYYYFYYFSIWQLNLDFCTIISTFSLKMQIISFELNKGRHFLQL